MNFQGPNGGTAEEGWEEEERQKGSRPRHQEHGSRCWKLKKEVCQEKKIGLAATEGVEEEEVAGVGDTREYLAVATEETAGLDGATTVEELVAAGVEAAPMEARKEGEASGEGCLVRLAATWPAEEDVEGKGVGLESTTVSS